jgi:hypothetical protein
MPTHKITRDILLAALAGFQLDKQRIDVQIAEVQAMLGVPAPEETPTKKQGKRSAAVRKRMAEAQKARWAKIKGEPPAPVVPEPPKAKRQISAEGMKRIVAATKKRWKKQRAEAAAKRAAPAGSVVKRASVTRKTAVKKSAAADAQAAGQ